MRVRILDTIHAAALLSHVDVSDIVGPSRVRFLIDLRAAIVKICRESGHSYTAIAERLNRDPSTVTEYLPNWPMYAERSPWIDGFADDLRAELQAAPAFAIEEQAKRRQAAGVAA